MIAVIGANSLVAAEAVCSENARQTRDLGSMLAQYWPTVYPAGPSLSQHWINVSFFVCRRINSNRDDLFVGSCRGDIKSEVYTAAGRTRHNLGSMSGNRRRRWPDIEPYFVRVLPLAGLGAVSDRRPHRLARSSDRAPLFHPFFLPSIYQGPPRRYPLLMPQILHTVIAQLSEITCCPTEYLIRCSMPQLEVIKVSYLSIFFIQ